MVMSIVLIGIACVTQWGVVVYSIISDRKSK